MAGQPPTICHSTCGIIDIPFAMIFPLMRTRSGGRLSETNLQPRSNQPCVPFSTALTIRRPYGRSCRRPRFLRSSRKMASLASERRGRQLGTPTTSFLSPSQRTIYLDDDESAIWLRVMPKTGPALKHRVTDIRNPMAAYGQFVSPLGDSRSSSFNRVRANDGYGIYAVRDINTGSASSIVFAFVTGEIWTIDTYFIRDDSSRAICLSTYSPTARP